MTYFCRAEIESIDGNDYRDYAENGEDIHCSEIYEACARCSMLLSSVDVGCRGAEMMPPDL